MAGQVAGAADPWWQTDDTAGLQSLRPQDSGAKAARKPAAQAAPAPAQARAIVALSCIIWRMIWARAVARDGGGRARSLAASVFYFYAQLPPLTDLLDGRARGSVTMLDRDGKVFAWRGETFGGQITARNRQPLSA